MYIFHCLTKCEFASSPGVNSKCSCPEEGLCGCAMAEEEDVEELQDEDSEEEERSVKLCRIGGGGGGGGWDEGRLLKGSSNAETQQKPDNTELSALKKSQERTETGGARRLGCCGSK